ncbi:MAG: ankyrin repeat domain-containing protein [Gammaproteobacteria bacterium]|nr:ankyrin repeat domain-containing protein [Gammaproteobacteria bacterium]
MTASKHRMAVCLFAGLLMAGAQPASAADAGTVSTAVDAPAESGAEAPGHSDPALVLAARYGQRDTVRLLLDQGVAPDSRDGLGRTALIAAAGESDAAMTSLLLARGADVAAADADGTTALMHAASRDRLDNVRLLLDAGADLNASDRQGETALGAAIRFGRVRIVDFLLAHGADPNRYEPGSGNAGYSPLMRAVASDLPAADSLAMVRGLLARGAAPDVVRVRGETAYTLAVRNGKTAAAEELLRAGARDETPYVDLSPEQALLRAVKLGDADKLARLLEQSVDPDYRDPITGITALASAAYRGENAMLELLIQHGADVNDVPWGLSAQRIEASGTPLRERELLRAVGRGDTALLTAIWRNDMDAVWILLDHGADIRLPNRDGDTPGIAAARAGNLDVMRALLAKGLDPNRNDPPLTRGYMITTLVNNGAPAPLLVEAARNGQVDMIGLLLDAGAAPDARDAGGRTALHWAVENGYAEAVELLLAHGADTNIVARPDVTPLMLAVQGGRETIARALLEHGADLDAIGNLSVSALDAAARDGNPAELARLLTTASPE